MNKSQTKDVNSNITQETFTFTNHGAIKMTLTIDNDFKHLTLNENYCDFVLP